MFYCPQCQARHKWPETMARSRGTCESCGRPAVCYDFPSADLPQPGDDSIAELAAPGPVGALSQLVLEVAIAPVEARMLLGRCRFCRNSLLYLLDTVPFAAQSASFRERLRALPGSHRLFHQNQAAVDHGDARVPQIRWITS